MKDLSGVPQVCFHVDLANAESRDRTGDTEFLTAARDGIAYETATFSSSERNWPDLRDKPESHFRHPCQWCHGSAGIGLARMGSLGICDDDSIRADIDVAIESTSQAPVATLDHMCCGNFGRLEVLFSAGQRLGNEAMAVMAGQRAAHLVSRAAQAGSFGWLAGTDRFNPRFFYRHLRCRIRTAAFHTP